MPPPKSIAGTAVSVAEAAHAQPAKSGRLSRLVLDLLRPYRGWLIIVFIAMLVEIAMSLAAPWPLKLVLDDALGHHKLPDWLAWAHDYGFGRHTLGVALFAGVATLFIAVFGAIATYIDNYYTTSVGQWVANDLRIRIYEHLHRLSLRYYDNVKTGALMSTITSDVATIQSFASSSTLDIVVDLITIVFMVGLMFWLDWDFTLIAVGFTPFLVVFLFHFKKAVKEVTRTVRARQSDIVAVVQEGLGSVRAVKAFGRQDLEVAHLEAASHATVEAVLKARQVKSLLSPMVNIVVAICTGIVLWKGTSLIVAGTMTAGALTVYLAYLSKFFKPVKDLASMTSAIAQTTVALERIQTILSADDIIQERADATDPGRLKGAITFDHVAFGYGDDIPVLRNVSFSIEPGQVVGIVGPTGSGKSTVLSLVPRFYNPTSGRVLIDGKDISTYKLASLRSQVGFVLQETVLFRGTIRENIAYGRPGATDEEVIAAAKIANADEFISRMPHGYDSAVGERGDTLSGGQRQRIGIARAVIRNSPIMILDEPTAALDTESERLVIEGLERLMEGRTVIMIAHRLSTIVDADKIIVLKDGVVAEEGSNDELIARGGVYAELHRVQYEPAVARLTSAA
ncbi:MULTISPECIES: ABC transporter ATP-binding protein [Bradyrhizobium]|uniref:ATP-binding cassette, subfamily B, MsbA n=2 Tax=Bradyrhizobium TaxID=374 RepID=A0ABY0QFS0_9BRAD|nr:MULTISPECIES: ABC transporter ATP-binding protein [Bradyrhizobium]SDK21839.1 ATP-binding cassette, subfamily B, MsbA [Bradyrhizobium ottawaense]SEE46499.1 ATP-binding cassette, subfamily B, MsbA [Bradyrhizobium lablabi]